MPPQDPNEHQKELFEPGQEFGEDVPMVYIATPLSHLQPPERDHVQALSHIVGRAILDCAQNCEEPWHLRFHAPIRMSAPWGEDEWSEEDIYRLNSGKLWTEADALIMLPHERGSLGMGQEMAWSGTRSLPILYLHREGATVSRQIEGAGSEHDLTIEPYRAPEHIHDLVGRWLLSRRHVIGDGPRRRRNLELRWQERHTAMKRAWDSLDPGLAEHVVATTRIAAGRIERMLSAPLLLAAASGRELTELAGALGLEGKGELFSRPLPELRPQQLQALGNAATEFEWGYETAHDLHIKARVEMARGGIRRLPLATSRDWAEFRRHHHGN